MYRCLSLRYWYYYSLDYMLFFCVRLAWNSLLFFAFEYIIVSFIIIFMFVPSTYIFSGLIRERLGLFTFSREILEPGSQLLPVILFPVYYYYCYRFYYIWLFSWLAYYSIFLLLSAIYLYRHFYCFLSSFAFESSIIIITKVVVIRRFAHL